MTFYSKIKLNLKESEDEFTELHREIVKLKGEKYWQGLMKKSNGHIGIPALKKILEGLKKNTTKPKVEEKKVEEPKLSTEEKEIRNIEEQLKRKDLKGQERVDLENDLKELKRGLKLEEREEKSMKINPNNLTKEQLWKLRQEIVLGSIYVNDYENSFGIEPIDVCNFFDSFIEDAEHDDEGNASGRDIKDYDNAEELYNYYSSCENPFGEIEEVKENSYDIEESEEPDELNEIKSNLEAIKNDEEINYEISSSTIDFPKILEKIDNKEDRVKALMMLYMANPKLEELKTWTAKQIKDYILDTEEAYNTENPSEEFVKYKDAYEKCFKLIGTDLNESEEDDEYWEDHNDDPVDYDIEYDEEGRPYFMYNNEKEYIDEYMRDDAGGAIKPLTAFSAIRIVPSDNGETVSVQYLHDSEDKKEEKKPNFVMFYLNGKELGGHDLENEFAGEREDARELFAYENGVEPDEIEVKEVYRESEDLKETIEQKYEKSNEDYNSFLKNVKKYTGSYDYLFGGKVNTEVNGNPVIVNYFYYERPYAGFGYNVVVNVLTPMGVNGEYIQEAIDNAFESNSKNKLSQKEIKDTILQTVSSLNSMNEAEETPERHDADIQVYMNTWKNYNEYGADLEMYGIKDGWMSPEEALEFCNKYAEDEPFINDVDNNTGLDIEISEYDNAPTVLQGLVKLNEVLNSDNSNIDASDIPLVYEAWSDRESVSTPSLENINEFIDFLENGEYYVHPDIKTTYDIGEYYVDNVGFEGVQNIENYVDSDKLKEEWQEEIDGLYLDDDGNPTEDWYEVDDYMVDEDIEMAAQANNKQFFEQYFDYESLGDDIYDDGYWYLSDNGAVEIY